MARLRTHFTEKTVLTARAIEERLYEQTWLREDYDLDHPDLVHEQVAAFIENTQARSARDGAQLPSTEP